MGGSVDAYKLGFEPASQGSPERLAAPWGPAGRKGLDAERRALVARLRSQRTEVMQVLVAGVRQRVPDTIADTRPELAAGSVATIAEMLDFGLITLEAGHAPQGELPTSAIEQARRLARAGVSMKMILRRYVAGSALFEDVAIAELATAPLSAEQRAALRSQIIEAQWSMLDRVLDGIVDAYMLEVENTTVSREQRRAELVHAALAGQDVSAEALGYELAGSHLGAIATGPGAEDALRELARMLRRDLLRVSSSEQTVWGWLGGGRPVASSEITRLCAGDGFPGVTVALGEPASGLDGFRLTHRQAQAVLLFARRAPNGIARFADAALTGLALRDRPIAAWLVDTYLRPLDEEGQGVMLRETLRVYLERDSNTASAAAALGLSRSTVRDRIAKIERLLNCSIGHRHAELVTALAVEALLDEA